MKVKCLANQGKYLNSKTLEVTHLPTSEFQLSIGDFYFVYGMCLWKGTLHYLTMDQDALPFWHPAELFKVVDNSLPMEWFFNFYGYGENDLSAVWGYKELVHDYGHYLALLEQEGEAIRVFLMRKKEIDEYLCY